MLAEVNVHICHLEKKCPQRNEATSIMSLSFQVRPLLVLLVHWYCAGILLTLSVSPPVMCPLSRAESSFFVSLQSVN